jgi:outer membrane protein assembly factor BamB
MKTILILILVQLLRPSGGQGDEWPQFRGPTGQGQASGPLPRKWSPTESIAWSREIPGRGWSSPVVSAGRIYLTTAEDLESRKVLSLSCLCLDADQGKIMWKQEIFRYGQNETPSIHSKNSQASPTPVVQEGRIYAHFGHLGTACLDPQGKVLWRTQEFRYRPVHGNGGSPCLAEGVLIFCCDGEEVQEVVGLDAATGQGLWRTPRAAGPTRPFSFGTPLAIAVGLQTQIICPGSDVVMSLNPRTGKEVWRVRYSGYSQVPRPVFGHGLVYVCTGFDSPKLLAIRPDGTGDVTKTHVAWSVGRNVPNTSSPLLVDDALYMVADNGIISCVEAQTGAYRWQGRLQGGFSASPIHAQGCLYCSNEQGVCFLLATGKEFKVLGRNDLSERTLASPAAANGRLLLRTESMLYSVK